MRWNIIIAVIVLGAAIGIGFLLGNRDDGVAPTPTPTDESTATPYPTRVPASPELTPTQPAAAHRVRLTASGPVPRDLTVRAGDLVTIVSEVDGYWPASDPHPVHTLCPGFDAKRALRIGDTYDFVFTVTRTCTYHDHLHPSDASRHGSITVQ